MRDTITYQTLEETPRERAARGLNYQRLAALYRTWTVEAAWRAIPAAKRNTARLSLEHVALVLDALQGNTITEEPEPLALPKKRSTANGGKSK